MQSPILIFADGASKGNPGPAGWGALVVQGNTVTELGAGYASATNNQMELRAVLEALQHAEASRTPIRVCTDSSYVLEGVNSWLRRWQANGWLTQTGEAVRNRELWEELAQAIAARAVQGQPMHWQHVPGHAGVAGNERVDAIAQNFAAGVPVQLYTGPLADYPFDPSDLRHDEKKLAQKAAKKQRSNQKAYSYLSLVDGVLQRHTTWAECEARVKGRSGVKYKKAVSPEDEEKIKKDWLG